MDMLCNLRFPEILAKELVIKRELICFVFRQHSIEARILINGRLYWKSSSIMNVTPVVGVNQIGDRPDGKGFWKKAGNRCKGIHYRRHLDKKDILCITRLTKSYRIPPAGQEP